MAAAFLTVALPGMAYAGTASAEPSDSVSTLATTHEWDRGVPGDGNAVGTVCGDPYGGAYYQNYASRGCFNPNGDLVYAVDKKADGKSALVEWRSYRNGVLLRQGYCRNALGAGTVAKCNKDFSESSTIYWRAGTYDAETDVISGWSDWYSRSAA